MVTCPTCGTQSSPGFRVCGQCGSQLAADRPPEEIRRIATVVTSDLKGSTALGEKLDPESLREVLTRYFDEMRVVFESHGGTIEKIIGDAIVAVFGLPSQRDDDALRAVQAAAESLRVLAVLNDQLEEKWGVRLITRTGVASGEVIVGELTAGAHVLTGETMRLAGAMEQNAPQLEVLLADSTYQLVKDQVETEPFGPVFARGSDEQLVAHRLLTVTGAVAEGPARPEAEGAGRTCSVCGEQNPADHRFCGNCGSELTGRRTFQESRKTVTIVFADPKPVSIDDAPIGPEALRDVMSRYFRQMQGVLERHGATVEKFIGDAVMAVFGLPIRHEDDALRAVRAAAGMQAALPELNAAFEAQWGVTLGNHIGVNTGEVVAGDPSLGQRLVSGDTVNVAARLEQAAGSAEVLLGDLTYRLVRGAVVVEPVAPLTLKGKAEPVPAYRLTGVHERAEGFERRNDAPMIGRDQEMEQLRARLAQAVAVRACRMVTVVGDAGVGKSRLLAEFIKERAEAATVIRGRCLPYGEGITFWPLREAVRDAAAIDPNDAADEARAKLTRLVPDPEVVRRLASAIGLSTDLYPVEEVVWAARKFLEGLAGSRPVIMVVDDIQWASPTFLDLIGSLIESIADASVLLLCTSRHGLLEAHPDWATDGDNLRIILEPLTEADAGRVVQGLLGGTALPDEVQARIAQGAAGNPLFVEQLLSMLVDNGTLRQEEGGWEVAGDLGQLDVPPTIQALLAARIDLLHGEERAVIEPASVIGQTFARAAVAELAPEPIQPEIDTELDALTRKQLIGQLEPTSDDEVTYRFPNILIKDAAYNGLLKRARAEFHERFVDWAEEINLRQGRGQEFEEIQGYHLEQAHRYLTELGTVDDHARILGERASVKLASAGRRAFGRGDVRAAVNLLRRAANTLPADQLPHLRLLPDLGEALMETGDFDEAELVLNTAQAGAQAIGDASLAAEAQLVRLLVEQYSFEGQDWSGRVVAAIDAATPIFEHDAYHPGLALAARLQVGLHGTANRYGQAAAASLQVIDHARAAGDARLEGRGAGSYAISALYGPTPVGEAIERSEELVAQMSGDRRTEGKLCRSLAVLYAMRGDFDKARATYTHAEGLLQELGGYVAASGSLESAQIEVLAGDLTAAEAALRRDYAALEAMGERYVLSSVAGLLARVLYEQGRFDEADEWSRTVESLSNAEDIDAQALWRGVRAKVLARRGQIGEARRLAEEMLVLRRQAESPGLEAEALADLAEVQRLSGDEGWQATLAAAVAGFQRKGDLASVWRLTAHANAGA
jgi:class 3 adenylate cyclase/Flp pilus assembly protein TadD